MLCGIGIKANLKDPKVHWVIEALGILYSALYIGIMLVVDLLYGVLDPRIRVSAKGKEA